MAKRIISTIRHPYTSKQILHQMLALWTANRYQPILLVARQGGEIESVVRSIRVALSKERSKQGRPQGTNYGFTQSTSFPFTEEGQTGEAVALRWRITQLQNLRNAVNTEEIRKKTYV